MQAESRPSNANCVSLLFNAQAVEDKYMEDEEMKSWKTLLVHLDKLFTVTFALEMLLKMTAYGPIRYYTDAWCWLDFVIVAVGTLNCITVSLCRYLLTPYVT